MKKTDVVDDVGDDDVVKTSVSQNCVTAKLCSEEFSLRTPYK